MRELQSHEAYAVTAPLPQPCTETHSHVHSETGWQRAPLDTPTTPDPPKCLTLEGLLRPEVCPNSSALLLWGLWAAGLGLSQGECPPQVTCQNMTLSPAAGEPEVSCQEELSTGEASFL